MACRGWVPARLWAKGRDLRKEKKVAPRNQETSGAQQDDELCPLSSMDANRRVERYSPDLDADDIAVMCSASWCGRSKQRTQ